MSNAVRIVLVVLCVVALYYLVVTLARSVSEQETGALAPAAIHLAAHGGAGDARAIGAHG